MNRIDRLHAMLTHLQSKKKVTASEMAGRFHISLRTVYRDIKALEGSGVPVIGEAGEGYTIMEGYRLPPVMFTREEASALMLGAKLAEKFTDGAVRRHYSEALFKIKAVLRSTDKEFIDDLTAHIEVSAARDPGDELSQQHLSAVQQAIVQKKILHLVYQADEGLQDPPTVRDIEPFGLWHYGSAWHLIAWCRLRNDYRDFRVSRIRRIAIREEGFDGDAHPSIREYIRQMVERNELYETVVRIDNRLAKHIQQQKLLYGFVSQEDLGHSLRMVFLVGCFEYFGRWLLTLTDGVIVESPLALQLVMRELAEKIQSRHGRPLAVTAS